MAKNISLQSQVDEKANPPLQFSRIEPFYPQIAASWLLPDTTPQNPTWRNLGNDAWIARVGYAVRKFVPDTTASGPLYDNGQAMGQSEFDFRWNMRLLSSQTSYGVSSGTGQGGIGGMLSRSALGNMQTGRLLTLERPRKVVNGDGVTFAIQPILYQAQGGENDRYTVSLTLDCYRTKP